MGVADSEVVAVGPENVDTAGDLVSRLGVRNQATRIIQENAKAHPREVVVAQARPVDRDRTLYLDRDEVADEAKDSFTDVGEVHSARVTGADGAEQDLTVVVLYELKDSGRTTRGLLPYDALSKSKKAFAKAEKEGELTPGADADSAEALRQRITELESQVQNERRRSAAAGDGTAASEAELDKTLDGNVAPVSKRIAKVDSDDELDALEAREKAGKDRTGVTNAIAARRDELKSSGD